MHAPSRHSGREFFAGLLETFTEVLGLARGYLRTHGSQTGHLARQLGIRLGCSGEEVSRLVIGGVLADVGMIGMAEEAWEVPSPILDPRSRARVRRHPARSHAILASVPHLDGLGRIVRHHHEWWDGSGYPDGLAGRAIPLESRILRLADTVTALQGTRPHRGPLGPDDVRYAVDKAAGEEFDPDLARVYLELASAGELEDFDEELFRQRTLQAATTLIPECVSPLSGEALLEILAAVVDAKDPYTAGHSKRVAILSVAAARQLGLDEEVQGQLWAAGYLHDIGKLGVPLRILTKPSRLSPEESSLLREHAGMGADVLCKVDALRHLAPAARYHHERWDGTGYPEGLSGERIPLLARILAVADAYDAMTTSRAYRSSRGHLVALEEVAHESGRQFSPEVARAFVALPEPFFSEFRQPANWRPEPFTDPVRRSTDRASLSR